MEWELKVKMIKSFNSDLNEFKDIVINNIQSFDEQAWSMFFTIIEITPEFVKSNIEFLNLVNNCYKKIEGIIEIGFRELIRQELLDQYISDYFKETD